MLMVSLICLSAAPKNAGLTQMERTAKELQLVAVVKNYPSGRSLQLPRIISLGAAVLQQRPRDHVHKVAVVLLVAEYRLLAVLKVVANGMADCFAAMPVAPALHFRGVSRATARLESEGS